MPKDKRLYMTLTIEFPEHPKVEPLSDAAFRAFIEMNCYSRRVDSDGVVPVAVAERRWSKKVLRELVESDPLKPLVVKTDEAFVIREYSEHQETRQSREDRAEKLRANGAKGGRPRKNQIGNQNETKLVSENNQIGNQNETKTITKTKAESESESELKQLNLESYVNPAHPSKFKTSDQVGEMRVRKSTYESLGINPIPIQAALVNALSRDVNEMETFRIVMDTMSRAPGLIKSPQAYMLTAIERSWAEIQQRFDRGEFGGAA